MNIFGTDSGVMRFLNVVSDICIISLLWLLCCLPLVTIGASSTAAYYTIVKVVHKKTGYLSREFFKSFRLNLKNALILTIIYELILAVLCFNVYFMYQQIGVEGGSSLPFTLLFVYLTLIVFVLGIMIYSFPALSRFDMNRMRIFRFSLYAVFRHLPSTLLMLIILIASIAIMVIFPVGVIFMPGVCLYAYSYLMERILRKYMTEDMLALWDGPNEEN